MLTCIARSKRAGDETSGQPDDPDSKQAKSLTSQLKDMALKASGAYRHCTPCTEGEVQPPIKSPPVTTKADPESDQRFKMLYGRSNSSITATAAAAATREQPRVWGKEMEARLKGISSGEATPKSASGRNRVDPIVFVEEKEPKEWVAQVEPGVLITFVSLPGGGNDLKRIRFSRDTFNKLQAQRWWADNYDKVMELYNVQKLSRQAFPLPTPPKSQDEKAKVEYHPEDTPATPPLNKERLPRNIHRPAGLAGCSSSDSLDHSSTQSRQFNDSGLLNSTPKLSRLSGAKTETSSITSCSSRDADRSEEMSVSNASDVDQNEWVEQDEPGVYITIKVLPCGKMGRRTEWPRKRSMATTAKVDTDDLRRFKDVNLDEAPSRRHVRDSLKDTQLNLDHILFKTPGDGIKTKESYEVNSRGVEIFSKSWLPQASSPRALVCFCHGYGDTCTFFFEGIARRLALSGYGVFAMDYPGFGLSQGLHGFIPSFDLLVEDVIEHYSNVKDNPEFSSLPSFLFGQSMGGAVSLKIHFKQPDAWTGAVLVAPMCKIADDMVPPPVLKQILIGLANVLPKHKLVPQKDLAEAAFRDVRKRNMTQYNVICYSGKPRLRTAVEMLRTTQEIEQQLGKVSLPILILHGEADTVTDPSVSRELYQKAKSSDKKIVLYKDAYHSLLEGEPDEMILRVLADIISWLDDHSSQAEGSLVTPPM